MTTINYFENGNATEYQNQNTDCLVLEYQTDNATIFIFYDWNEEAFVLRGCRNYSFFSFLCKDKKNIQHFLTQFEQSEVIQFIFHNYFNLPCDANDIDFETLNDYEDGVVIFSKIKSGRDGYLRSECFLKDLGLIKNFYNNY